MDLIHLHTDTRTWRTMNYTIMSRIITLKHYGSFDVILLFHVLFA